MDAQLPSSNSPASPWKYDVFLSFRGDNIRKNFTDHLYTALCNAGFCTFRDDDKIPRGQSIQPQFEQAIEESSMSLIVFSKNYAQSSWCLDELALILDRKRNGVDRHVVLPVFYDVHPREVGNQKGSFKEAFDEYEESDEHSKGKIDRWREALKEASRLTGIVIQDVSNSSGHHAEFIQKIVKQVGTILKRKFLSVDSYTVGIESRVNDIDLWLKEPADVGVGVMSGMGGIGKTTIAKVLYNWLAAEFEASSFLMDIREACEKRNGLVGLQSRLLSDISKGEKQEISNITEGTAKIQHAIYGKRFLIVLDDVCRTEQVAALVGAAGDWFHKGSKIIITTSRDQLLSRHKHTTFIIKPLDTHESLELFLLHAFPQAPPMDGILELSERFVQHCDGLPLAIRVLGSSLYGRNLDFWASALEKLEAIPDQRIRNTLQLTYSSLHDHDKRLFLDIALFFVGEDKDHAAKTLEHYYDFYSKDGMQNLMDKSLVMVDKYNRLGMHDLVHDMATEVIRQEAADHGPGKHNLYNSTGAKSETVTTEEGSLLSKNDKRGKRKRLEDYEDVSMPPNEDRPSLFKRLYLGFCSLLDRKLLKGQHLKTNARSSLSNAGSSTFGRY